VGQLENAIAQGIRLQVLSDLTSVRPMGFMPTQQFDARTMLSEVMK
jgi:hypothetical protein